MFYKLDKVDNITLNFVIHLRKYFYSSKYKRSYWLFFIPKNYKKSFINFDNFIFLKTLNTKVLDLEKMLKFIFFTKLNIQLSYLTKFNANAKSFNDKY